MNLKQIQHALKNFFSRTISGGKDRHSRTRRQWEIMLGIFFVSNLVVLGFSLYLFLKINEGGIFLVEQSKETRVSTIDRGVLQELLQSFEIKEALFKDRMHSAPELPDPSL